MVSGLERLLQADLAGAETTEPSDAHRNGMVALWHDNWHLYARPIDVGEEPGRVVAEFVRPDGGRLAAVEAEDGQLHLPFQLDEAYRNYVAERWAAESSHRRISARQLALFYRLKRYIPRSAQLAARRAVVRWQGMPTFPSWPLDDGVHRLLALYASWLLSREGARSTTFRWFWPAGARAALVLSHDVESDAGVRLAVELADLEESLGFRSSFNFGAWYDVDPGVLRDLTSRGFEVGIHGLVHDRSLFSSRTAFEQSLPELAALARRLDAVGFRSPATHRVVDWIAELPVEYDGTIPHSDPYEPQPGGCCSLWPFFVGEVVELPYTLPQDHTLLTLLGHRTATLWIETAREIERRFGLIHCISHPDPGYLGDPAKRRIYAEFLTAMREAEDVWHAVPAEVAAWWRSRSSDAGASNVGHAVRDEEDPLHVTFAPPAPRPDRGAPAAPPTAGAARTRGPGRLDPA